MKRHIGQLTGKETTLQVESFANGQQKVVNKLGKEEYLKRVWNLQRKERNETKTRLSSPEEILGYRRERK